MEKEKYKKGEILMVVFITTPFILFTFLMGWNDPTIALIFISSVFILVRLLVND